MSTNIYYAQLEACVWSYTLGTWVNEGVCRRVCVCLCVWCVCVCVCVFVCMFVCVHNCKICN